MKFVQRLIPLLLLALVATSCDSLIYERGDDCPTLLRFAPYVQTPCMEDPDYPQGVDVVTIAVYSPKGQLLTYKTFDGVQLSPETVLEVSVAERCDSYRCYLWAGALNADYALKPDLSSLPAADGAILSLIPTSPGRMDDKCPHRLFHASVDLPNVKVHRAGISTVLTSTPLLTEYTNDFIVRTQGLNPKMPARIEIRDHNARYDLTGTIAEPRELFTYAASLDAGASEREAMLRTLRLDDITTHPKLVLVRPDTGEELMNFDLKKDLLAKLPHFKPECDHLYTVDLRFSPSMSVEISINGWVVHSYSITL
ncbi:MAG: FimB/Mfa2 family fimbrial subunit [Bacteroidales bacterium]|nr:FimB/Mfa2 family fimbrial subunit [Porphyromonas sp.]MDD6934280.1 FimB/Mfa2 family fimbrial subunit [Bacteroidales bacterium]MDY3101562.1 FimB/Mfa2 family fimbrial subunit [Porphyromonas sp.]